MSPRLSACVLLVAGFLVLLVHATDKVEKLESPDIIVATIVKKQFDQFVKDLQKTKVDINVPDSKGRLAVIEAVRTGDIRFVDSLIQYGASCKIQDNSTGVTPLHIAFQRGSPQISRVLLKYGADPNLADKAGKKAREVASSKDLQALLQDYDKDGSEAFEDQPGTWMKGKNDKGDEFWFNMLTNESRWNVPPSCSWHRVPINPEGGHPYRYINAITEQEIHRIPVALSWRKVQVSGKDLWYNWRKNTSQVETPQELPPDLLEELEKEVNVRWINTVTGEISWEDPANHSPWRVVKADEKGTFYHHTETGESTWEVPEELAWTEVENEEKQKFYHNPKTGESTWEAPKHLAWSKAHDEL